MEIGRKRGAGEELMEFIFEVIFQFLGEILLQIIFEALAELGLRAVTDPLKKPRNPVLSTIGFVLWGAIAGGISLWILPASLITNPDLRKINLVLTPAVIAFVMMLLGKFRSKRGQDLVRLDRFYYAYLFALTMALVRFIFTA